MTDLPPSTLAVAWPQTSHSTAVAAFVRAAVTVAAQAYPAGLPDAHSVAAGLA